MHDDFNTRTRKRSRVLWDAKLRRDGRVLECEVLDISTGGVRARVTEPLAIKSTVVLMIDRLGAFAGEVGWRRGDHVGIGFLENAGTIEERLHLRGVITHPDGDVLAPGSADHPGPPSHADPCTRLRQRPSKRP